VYAQYPGQPPPGYGGPYGAGYPAPYHGYSPAAPFNALAIASLVLGLLWFGGVASLGALILGIVALHQITERDERGRGLAIAGVVLGGMGVAGAILLIGLAIANAHFVTPA